MAAIEFRQIGVIHTPYTASAPFQPVQEAAGEFRIVVDPAYAAGLRDLETFHYIYVLYYVHQARLTGSLIVSPPWTNGLEVGVFASRTPDRPNPLGLSIVRLKQAVGNELWTSGLDVFDGTPLLDLKPYIKELDSKVDANYGWLERLEGREHLLSHIHGVPHAY